MPPNITDAPSRMSAPTAHLVRLSPSYLGTLISSRFLGGFTRRGHVLRGMLFGAR